MYTRLRSLLGKLGASTDSGDGDGCSQLGASTGCGDGCSHGEAGTDSGDGCSMYTSISDTLRSGSALVH